MQEALLQQRSSKLRVDHPQAPPVKTLGTSTRERRVFGLSGTPRPPPRAKRVC